jgi:ABC-type nitrate/sulfonate/bicarbonate transport system substrate-binding protein
VHRFTRREVVKTGIAGAAVGALGPVLAACGGSTSNAKKTASSLTPVSFQLSWIAGNEWAGTYIAQERGYFAEEGIDLTVLPGGPSVTVEPLVATNKVLVGMTYGLGTATTVENGGSIKIFANQYQRSADVIASLAKKPIRTPQDLIGKTIGVPSDAVPVLQAFLGNNHIQTSQVHQVPVQSSLDPLVNGQVEGMLTYSTEAAELNSHGIQPVLLFLSDYHYYEMSNAYGASAYSIEHDSDTIVKFMRGEIRGWQDCVKDPEYGAHLTVSKYAKGAGLSLKETVLEIEQTIALMTYGSVYREKGLFWLTPESEQNVLAGVNAALKKPVTASEIFDDTIMPKVYAGAKSIS